MVTTELTTGLQLPDDRFVFGEERWADIGGYRMRYLRAGSGPPLLLIHGLMGYSFSWRRNLQVLSDHFTVYAIDLPGIGYSQRPPRGALTFDLRSIAIRLLDWMKSEGLHHADVIGTSHGGGIAIFMTEMDRHRATGLIRRLILVASINPWSTVGRRRTRLFSHPFGAFCMRTIGPMLPYFQKWGLQRMYGDPSKITPDTRAGYQGPLVIPGTLDYVLGIVQHWVADMLALRQAIENLDSRKMLLLWGELDSAVPVESAYELQKQLPGSEMEVLKGVGHLPYEESPEEFNRAVMRFLSK